MSKCSRSKSAANDKGISLILVMLALLVFTALAATLVFTARSDTFASYSYKLNAQADYVAKAGIQAAVNWFRSGRYQALSSGQVPTYYDVTSDGSTLSLYSSNTSPVNCVNSSSGRCPSQNTPVQLISYGGGKSNYPADVTNSGGALVTTEYQNDLKDVKMTGDAVNSGHFCVNAYLLNYQTVNCPSCAVKPAPMETWLVTSLGTWGGTSCASGVIAQAEEQAVIQPIFRPTWGNALYGYCGVTMSGSAGTCTDAFNSALGAYGGGNPSVASGACDSSSTNVIDSGAGVGANGYVNLSSNVSISGNVTIGSVGYTPPSSCCSGGGCGYSGGGSVQGSVVNAPPMPVQSVPTFPANFPSNGLLSAPSFGVSVTLPQISIGNSTFPLAPILPGLGNLFTWPCMTGVVCNGGATNPYLISNVSLTGGSLSLTLTGGPSPANPVYYDIDSVTESGLANLVTNGYVVLNVRSSLSITGQGVANPLTTSPEALQINYAGTSAVSIGGNGGISAIISAPNATVNLGGAGSKGYLVGAVQAGNINDLGGYPVHYDLQLGRAEGTLSPVIITSYARIKQ